MEITESEAKLILRAAALYALLISNQKKPREQSLLLALIQKLMAWVKDV